MSHVDEGLVHAWLEDQLPPDEAARVERLVSTDPAWGAAAAEARGLIAATARVIGALDSAPSSVGDSQTKRNERMKRTGVFSVRKTWLRAAAAIALVAGVSGVWFSSGDNVTTPDARLSDAIQPEKKPVMAETPAPTTPPIVVAPSAQVRERRSMRNVVPNADRPRSASVPTPPPVARDEVAAVAKSVVGATDTVLDRRAGVGGGVGGGGRAGGRGGGGRAAPLVEQGVVARPMEMQRSDMMNSLAATQLDSVFRGCWIPTDSSPRRTLQSIGRAANERSANDRVASEPMVLRFTQPVATDLPSARAPASPPAGALQVTQAQANAMSALRAAPPRARVQHATPRMKDDSTLVAEWLNADRSTTQLMFRLRGDTLRGTTSSITGDLVIAGSVLVAVRAQCPQ